MSYHLIPVRMGIIKKSVNNQCWWECREKRRLARSWWECKLVQPLWRTVRRVHKTQDTELLVAQLVKNPRWSLLWFGLLLWHGSNPWPKNFLMLSVCFVFGVVKKKKKSQNRSTIWFSNSTWVYIWKKKKTLIWKGTSIPMFIEGLCMMAKIWKQPKCLPTGEWIKKMSYICMHIQLYVHTLTHTHSHTHNGILATEDNEILPLQQRGGT